jgi:hypothetical protein
MAVDTKDDQRMSDAEVLAQIPLFVRAILLSPFPHNYIIAFQILFPSTTGDSSELELNPWLQSRFCPTLCGTMRPAIMLKCSY